MSKSKIGKNSNNVPNKVRKYQESDSDNVMEYESFDDIKIIRIIKHKYNKQSTDEYPNYLVKYRIGMYKDSSVHKTMWLSHDNMVLNKTCREKLQDYWSSNNLISVAKKSKNINMSNDRIDSNDANNANNANNSNNVHNVNEIDALAFDVASCDPFANTKIKYINKEPKNINNDDDQKPIIGEKDVVAEIENILDWEVQNDVRNYLIKWVGSKIPTWISEEDFIERDLLREFLMYEANRHDKSLSRRAYIYCRTSCRNAEREVSLYDQEKYCLEFAKKNNINIIGVYRDNGVSAKNMKNQFALNFICKQIEKGDCILFYDVSRFSRSMLQALERLEYLRNNIGAIVHACHDGLTWNAIASNRNSFRQNLSHSQLQSETISEKVISAIEYRRERGDHIGYVPFGYKTELIDGSRKLVHNKSEQLIIRAIIDFAMDIITERLNKLKISKNKKSGKTMKPSKKQIKENMSEFTPAEYRTITNNINKQYTNRNNKRFTWRFIKGIILKWSAKI